MYTKSSYKFQKGEEYQQKDLLEEIESEFIETDDSNFGGDRPVWDRDVKITITATWKTKR